MRAPGGGAGAVGGELWWHEEPLNAVQHGEGLRMGEDGASSSPHPPPPAPHRRGGADWGPGDHTGFYYQDVFMLSLTSELLSSNF